MKTYYDILGVSGGADKEAIKSAFRAKAKKVHPDVAQDSSSAKEDFVLLREAYEVLSDTRRRKEYDEWIRKNSQRGSGGNSTTRSDTYARANVSEDQKQAYDREWKAFREDYRKYFDGIDSSRKKVLAGLLAGLLMTAFNIVFCIVVIGLVVGVIGGTVAGLTSTGWGVIGAIFVASYSFRKLGEMNRGNWPDFAEKYANHVSGLFYVIMSSSGTTSKRAVTIGVRLMSVVLTIAGAVGAGYGIVAAFEAFKADMKYMISPIGELMVLAAAAATAVAFVALLIWIVMSIRYTGYLCRTVRGRMPEVSETRAISRSSTTSNT